MATQLLQTKNAIYKRTRTKGKGPKPLIPPPQNAGWKQHHAHPAYYGRPDGKVWSAKRGRILEGCIPPDGYTRIGIGGKLVKRARFNLSLSLGRAIKEAMECDHIVSVKEGGGDDWANLQELTRADHNRKTTVDNPDKGKKQGITRGVPIVACHEDTGDETRCDSINEAVRELGISYRAIERSLKGETIRGDYVFSHTPEYLAEQADLPGELWLEAVSKWGVLPNTEASDRGRIQDSRGRWSYGNDSQGYKRFGAMIDKKRSLKVHDVIGRTFLEPPPSPNHTPDHINGDPSDNRVENLRWATELEQGRNRRDNRRVIQLDADTGEQLAVFESLVAAAEAVRISVSGIGNVAGGRQLTAGGFKWMWHTPDDMEIE
jgi:5-methylcytosine-specific restriction endonuclease McrA